MNKRYVTLSKILFAVSDLLLINFCLFICYYLSGHFSYQNETELTRNLIASSIIWLSSGWLFNLYHEYTIVRLRTIKRATLRSVVFYLILFNIYSLLFSYTSNLSTFLVTFYVIIIGSFSLTRYTYTAFESILSRLVDDNDAVNVFAIASIGGHWVQLLRLMPLFKLNDVSFISTKPSLGETVEGHRYFLVPDANRNNKTGLVKCCLSIGARIVFTRPKVIVTTGAAPGLFGIFIGRILGVKTIWIDSIANVEKLSLSGKIASKIADRVYTQWEHLATPKIIFAGNILEG